MDHDLRQCGENDLTSTADFANFRGSGMQVPRRSGAFSPGHVLAAIGERRSQSQRPKMFKGPGFRAFAKFACSFAK
jgi:hypothetical protein